MGLLKELIKIPFGMVKRIWKGLAERGGKSREYSTNQRHKDKAWWVVPDPVPAAASPVPVPAPAATPFVEAFDPSTLSCENHEVSVDATIDYVDKYGNATRRDITTEEIYDYEDGVVVIRAFCHRRKDYRTFLSSRIKYWVDTNSGKPVSLQNLANYLVKASKVDLTNIAINISSMAGAEVQVFVHTAGKYTRNTYTSRNGLTYYRISVLLVNALVDYLLELPRSRMLIESLNSSQYEEVKDILRGNLQIKKVTETQVFLSKKILKESELSRRKKLVDFAETALKGMPEQGSVVQVLSDELLDPSFRIATPKPLFSPQANPEQKKELDEYLAKLAAEKQQTVADIKSDSEDAEKELEEVAQTELPTSKTRARKYRKSAELNVIRNLARQECQTELLKNLQEGTLIIERGPFEQEIRRRVCALLTEEEIARYGEMMLPYLGNGIQFGYLVTGLKKKNRGWYANESGKVVIDLNNVQKD
jgi:hypothetical protein